MCRTDLVKSGYLCELLLTVTNLESNFGENWGRIDKIKQANVFYVVSFDYEKDLVMITCRQEDATLVRSLLRREFQTDVTE